MNWTRSQNIVWEEIEGSTLLVDATSGVRWRLNAAAAAAWRLCDGTHSLSDLSAKLSQSNGEIVHFFRQIAAHGLLQAPLKLQTVSARTGGTSPFSIQPLGLGAGPRRRPTPRGVSGPG